MAAPATLEPSSARYPRVAGPVHTAIVLAFLGAWAYVGVIGARRINAGGNPHRALGYLFTLAFEWILLGIVLAGVRRKPASMEVVLGQRWRSARQLFRDIGIAAIFWIVSISLVALLTYLLHASAAGKLQYIVPRGATQIALWIALSISAGICEEATFRGYLQRQFIASTNSIPAGITISAAIFGAVHAYQGFRMTIVIALYGAMFGILAHWRGTVRPGMMAHAWEDTLSGIAASLVRR
jgi:uncharacterized protein